MLVNQLAAASAAVLALVPVLLLVATAPAQAQLGAQTAFLGQLGPASTNQTQAAPVCSGKTPARLVIESVTPIAATGGTAEIVIRNQGGQTANVTGFRLSGGAGNESSDADTLYIADNRQCRENGTIAPGQALFFRPTSASNPCGFSFQLGPSGTVTLADYDSKPVSQMSWTNASEGMQIHITPDGTSARRVPGNQNVVDVLRSLGDYQTFVLALQATGLDAALTAASDPNYSGPILPEQQFQIDLPWWFASAQPGATVPPPPPPPAPAAPAPVGVPAAGPYTIMAPTDDAFDAMLLNLGGGQTRLPLDQLLRLPQLKDILLYHIVPGEYTSAYLRNNTPIFTAKGVEVVPFADGCMTEGKLMLHDSCIDKPTADNYTCEEQKTFQKCDFPFMISSLAAQWQGGFCQRTCQRCDCSPQSGILCSTVVSPDLAASNGVIHGISRVLFPPPLFTKEQAIAEAIAYNESLARNQSLGIAPAPGMTGLNEAPGTGAPLTPTAPITGALTPTPGLGPNATGATPTLGAPNATAATPSAGAPTVAVPPAGTGATPAGAPAAEAVPEVGLEGANTTSAGTLPPNAGRRRLQGLRRRYIHRQ